MGQVSTPTANVTQSMQKTTDTQKIDDCVAALLDEQMRAENNGVSMPLTIVFVERKLRCDDVAEALRQEGLKAAALHGGLSQGERTAALAEFTSGHIHVLVATDVASRGLDIKGIGHVVNLDLPRTFEDYVHRIGRSVLLPSGHLCRCAAPAGRPAVISAVTGCRATFMLVRF